MGVGSITSRKFENICCIFLIMSGLLVYLCDASDRDGDTMAGVDLVTLHIQGQGVQRDPRVMQRKTTVLFTRTIESVKNTVIRL